MISNSNDSATVLFEMFLCLEKEDAINRARWRVGVGEIAVRVG